MRSIMERMRIQLTKNFFLHEFTRSQTAARYGIKIIVNEGSLHFHRLKRLCENILQPLRDEFNAPINISSGYRPLKLNRKIGGAKKSAHIEALATDFTQAGFTPYETCQNIIEMGLTFDKLIHEFGQWVHVSVASENNQPRKIILTAVKKKRVWPLKPKTIYLPGLLTMEEAERRIAA